jgi:hypothetical protein
MPLFTYPTVPEIKSEVRLTPAQVGVTLTTDSYSTDIEDRIGEEAALGEVKLAGLYSEASLATMTTNEVRIATKWAELRVAASLYHSAGQLNEKYKDEALDYERRAQQYWDALTSSIGSRESALPVIQNQSFSVTPTRTDGYSQCGAEYSRCDRYGGNRC